MSDQDTQATMACHECGEQLSGHGLAYPRIGNLQHLCPISRFRAFSLPDAGGAGFERGWDMSGPEKGNTKLEPAAPGLMRAWLPPAKRPAPPVRPAAVPAAGVNPFDSPDLPVFASRNRCCRRGDIGPNSVACLGFDSWSAESGTPDSKRGSRLVKGCRAGWRRSGSGPHCVVQACASNW